MLGLPTVASRIYAGDYTQADPPPKLRVRTWTAEDTEQAIQWFAEDPTLWRYIPGLQRPLTSPEVRDHLHQRLQQQEQGAAMILAVDRGGSLACQFVVFPLVEGEGACHFLVARYAKGHGLELMRAAIAEAQRRGVKKIVGIPSPLLPQEPYLRFMRRLGFTIKFYGEILR